MERPAGTCGLRACRTRTIVRGSISIFLHARRRGRYGTRAVPSPTGRCGVRAGRCPPGDRCWHPLGQHGPAAVTPATDTAPAEDRDRAPRDAPAAALPPALLATKLFVPPA